MDFKLKHVRRFLEEGDKVKITCRFRGREITHPETAQRQLDLLAERILDIGMVETSARMEGRTMTLVLAPRVSKAQMMAKRRQEEARQKKTGEPVSATPEREELAPLTDQDDDDWDDEDEDVEGEAEA
jgi:translation initiation factor IF-3